MFERTYTTDRCYRMIFAFLAILFFGVWGFYHVKNKGVNLTPTALWNLGFGSINQNAMVFLNGDGVTKVITLTIIANIPQVILSIIYMVYMGIITTMFLAADWTTFAFRPQTLMVSSPAGTQRGTWMFGAPIGWGLTFMSFSILLHWFISQSIFVVQMQVMNKDGTLKVYDPATDNQYVGNTALFSNCGFSPIAMICSTVAAFILLLSVIIFMFRRFPAGSPPVVSTCSAAISASCHPITKTEDMLYKELRWGIDGGYSNGVGHCSLVTAEAWDIGRSGPPVEGYTYAGYRDEPDDKQIGILL